MGALLSVYLCRHGVRELLHAGAEVHPLEGRRLVRESRELLHQHEVHEHSLLYLRVPHLPAFKSSTTYDRYRDMQARGIRSFIKTCLTALFKVQPIALAGT